MEVQNRKTQIDRQKAPINYRQKLILGLVATPLILIALIMWGLIEPYILDDEEETAIIPNLPTAWEGQKNRTDI